ncbi:MAG: ShlB/FhaC/HecB family hemolysin secretion/activation protein [Sphingomonas sp.]
MISVLMLAAVAQTVPGATIVDRARVDRAPQAPVASGAATPKAATHVTTGGATIAIAGIRFDGAKAPRSVADAARRFLGQTADSATLQQLAAALSAAYGHSRVALYTIAIPEQDFAGGVVVVHLVEGRIEHAAIKGDAAAWPQLRARMAPLLAEAPLTRATFERQVILMRAIPGVTFDIGLDDPQSTGALAMTVTPKRRHHKFSVGFSNRGVDLLGQGQFDAKADFYGLATDGDQLSLAASAASDLRRYRYASGAYMLPIGASGLNVTGNAGYLETRPKGYDIIGRAKLAGLTLAYPWLRDFHHSGDVTLGIDGLNSDNALFGNLVATERTRALRAAAGWTMGYERRSLSINGSVSHGLDILGARVTAPSAERGFLKGTLAASAAQAIGKRAVLRLSASGQYTRDRLPAAERFSIGGEAIGRAFDTALLTGDAGAGGLAELAYRPVKRGGFGQSEVYTFVDRGAVAVRARGAQPAAHYDLASAGVGFRARYKEKAELGLEAARSIDDPYPGYADDWRLSVEWRLTL